ncbi:MAG: hypothetical protein HY322_01840 [Betaproteobacteria bacterium]|nr:hypothetical protein [Betaproteobacteria bacterium]
MEVEFFKDIESDAVYACVGAWASNALFRLRKPLIGRRRWEFLTPGSPEWDAVHQGIFRNSRASKVSLDEFSYPLPPLPEIPRGPFPEWQDYFAPQKPIRASKYPSVTEFLKSRQGAPVTAYIVLHEDQYETAFGDGEFHYFQDVFLSSEEAQRYMDAHRGEWQQFHPRTMSVQLDRRTLVFPDFAPKRYDHYTPAEVLTALEARLRGRP